MCGRAQPRIDRRVWQQRSEWRRCGLSCCCRDGPSGVTNRHGEGAMSTLTEPWINLGARLMDRWPLWSGGKIIFQGFWFAVAVLISVSTGIETASGQ